jgi:predicted MFS family arabinose efflux permease
MTAQGSLIPVTESPDERPAPMHLRYFSLLRSNREFRRLWMAQLISEVGDWFYSLAVYDLLLELTRSGKAVSWAIIIQTLPWFFMTPLAGHIVDRFSRRRLMIVADLIRGFVVLGLLLVRTRSEVWLVYALLGLEVVFASLFEPARNALLPNVVSEEQILPANALSSGTWSLALTVGAAIGGTVTALFGRQVAFIVNSVSFFASALLIQRIHCQEPHLKPVAHPLGSAPASASPNSLREGAEYLGQNPKVLALVLAKAGLGIVGGVLLLLTLFGERVFPLAGRGPLAMGLLFAARGVGAGMGPLIGDQLTRSLESRMWKSISLSFFLIGTSYLLFSRAPNLLLAALAVFCAHLGGSNTWVMTTTLLQLNTADRFRGRVFALDLGLNMLAAAGSNYLIGVGLDTWKFSPRQLAAALGAVLILPGLAWLPVQARWAEETGVRD